MKIRLYLALAVVLFAAQLHAQTTKTGRKIKEARQTTEDAGGVIITTKETIENIFSIKKKSKEAVEEAVKENAGKEADKAIDKPQTGNTKNSTGLQPGDVHPNAKVIDADILYPFNNGLATVSKGTALALINAKGEFTIPYNSQYQLLADINPQIIQSQNKYFSTDGKLLAESNSGSNTFWRLNQDYKYLENIKRDANSPTWSVRIVDKEGKKYEIKNLPSEPQYLGEETFSVRQGVNDKSAVINFKGVYVTKFIYYNIDFFVSDMARVTKVDDFGKTSYGFIDKTGKEVIPTIYSRMPTNFLGELASVYPANGTEFAQAIINKKGDIILKLPNERLIYYIGNGFYFYDARNIMDVKGKIISIKEFLKSYGVEQGLSDKEIMLNVYRDDLNTLERDKADDGMMWYTRYSKKNELLSSGFINTSSGKSVEAAFEVSPHMKEPVFDPVTKLALVKLRLGKDNQGGTIYKEGYINEDGVFMIVKGEKSKW